MKDIHRNLSTDVGQMCFWQGIDQKYWQLRDYPNDFVRVKNEEPNFEWLKKVLRDKFHNLQEENIISRFSEFVEENSEALSDYRYFFADIMYVLIEFVSIKSQEIIEAWLDIFVRAVKEDWVKSHEFILLGSRFNYEFVNNCTWTVKREMMPKLFVIFPPKPFVHENAFINGFHNGLNERSNVTFEAWWADMVSEYMSHDILYDMIHTPSDVWISHPILDQHFPVTDFDVNMSMSKEVFDAMLRYDRWIFKEESDKVYAIMKYGAQPSEQ